MCNQVVLLLDYFSKPNINEKKIEISMNVYRGIFIYKQKMLETFMNKNIKYTLKNNNIAFMVWFKFLEASRFISPYIFYHYWGQKPHRYRNKCKLHTEGHRKWNPQRRDNNTNHCYNVLPEPQDLPPVDPLLCNVSVYTFLKPHTGYKTQSSNKIHIISQLVTKLK